jgi:hypothetical protein
MSKFEILRRTIHPGNSDKPGMAYMFTFPFMVYADTQATLDPIIVSNEDALMRVFPPFRSAPPTFDGLPNFDFAEMPIPEGAARRSPPSGLRPINAIPRLPDRNGEHPAVSLYFTDRWTNKPRHLPMDSLRVDLLSARSRVSVSHWVGQLLQVIRSLTGQWWIGFGASSLSGGYLKYSAPIDSDGSIEPGLFTRW